MIKKKGKNHRWVKKKFDVPPSHGDWSMILWLMMAHFKENLGWERKKRKAKKFKWSRWNLEISEPRDPLKIFRMALRLTGGWLALHREGLYQLFFWFGLIYGLARLVALQIIIYVTFVAFLCLLGCLWLRICLLTAFSTQNLSPSNLSLISTINIFF